MEDKDTHTSAHTFFNKSVCLCVCLSSVFQQSKYFAAQTEKTHPRAHAPTHTLEPLRILLSPVTSSLFVSLLIKMTVVKLSARLSVTAAMIGADRLSICLKQPTGGSLWQP